MKIILASQSPRRRFLLQKMGVEFEVIPSSFEEYFDESRSAQDVAEELGLGKALDVAKKNPDAIVIGGDLIIVHAAKQIGKPADDEEARSMLRSFSNSTHELICSVAVVCKARNYQKVSSSSTTITFDELTEEFISQYVATGTTHDKAGGYHLRHPLIKPHIKEINGRMDLILGIPTDILTTYLHDFGLDAKTVDNSELASLDIKEFSE